MFVSNKEAPKNECKLVKIKEYISVLNKSSYPDELPNSIGIQIGSNNLETNHKISLKTNVFIQHDVKYCYYYTTNDVTSYITLVKTSGQYIHILTAHKLYINLPEILFYSIYVNESVIYYGFHP